MVEGVYGFSWLNVKFEGKADHAGPTPMHLRQDAMVATADVVSRVRRLTTATGTDQVGTVRSIDVSPNSINVIPETVGFTVDLRSYDNEVVDRAVTQIRDEIEWAADREGLE